jgi:hypothetical protein
MAEKTDLKKVQAALDRAAREAVSGPKEARAGRFAPKSGVKPSGLATPVLPRQPVKHK